MLTATTHAPGKFSHCTSASEASRPVSPSMGRPYMKRRCPGSRPASAGAEDQAEHNPDEFRPGRTSGAREQPGPSQRAGQQRQAERGHTFELQQQIADPCADEPGPVVRRPADCVSANSIERGVGGTIGDESEKKEDRGDQHQQPD